MYIKLQRHEGSGSESKILNLSHPHLQHSPLTIQAKSSFIQSTLSQRFSHSIRSNPIKKISSFLALLRSEG